jgi:hypothetical protein
MFLLYLIDPTEYIGAFFINSKLYQQINTLNEFKNHYYC